MAEVVRYFKYHVEDGKCYIKACSSIQYILGRDGWLDFEEEYGDILFSPPQEEASDEDKQLYQEAVDLIGFFGGEERLQAEIILETDSLDVENITVHGRNEAIKTAEEQAGINPDLLREMVWVEGAEDTPGVIILPHDDYDRVYILKGSRDNPTIQFIDDKETAKGVRPYYEKPRDGKTYIYVDGFSGGSGTQEDPYLIHDVHELQAMKNNLNAHYALAQDIDASETVNWNDGAGFEPIGTSSPRFSGSFDGRGHKIIGLHINRPTENGVGLFGYIGTGARIQNVRLIDGAIVGDMDTGGVVGLAFDSSVTQCYNTGSVTGNRSTGGVVGVAVVGLAFDSSVTQCYNTGSVTGGYYTGGVVGAAEGTVSQCYNAGAIVGDRDTGGVVGLANGTVSQCYNTGNVTGYLPMTAGALVGYRELASTISSCYWDTETSGVFLGVGSGSQSGVFGKTTAQMKQQSTYSGWDFDDIWDVIENSTYPWLRVFGPPPSPQPKGGIVRYWDGNEFRVATAYYYNGSQWVPAQVMIYDGFSWTLST